jgi:hypothetical protein
VRDAQNAHAGFQELLYECALYLGQPLGNLATELEVLEAIF